MRESNPRFSECEANALTTMHVLVADAALQTSSFEPDALYCGALWYKVLCLICFLQFHAEMSVKNEWMSVSNRLAFLYMNMLKINTEMSHPEWFKLSDLSHPAFKDSCYLYARVCLWLVQVCVWFPFAAILLTYPEDDLSLWRSIFCVVGSVSVIPLQHRSCSVCMPYINDKSKSYVTGCCKCLKLG